MVILDSAHNSEKKFLPASCKTYTTKVIGFVHNRAIVSINCYVMLQKRDSMDQERKVEIVGTVSVIDEASKNFNNQKSSEISSIGSEPDELSELAESPKKADFTSNPSPSQSWRHIGESMPILLPDTDYSCLLWEKGKHLVGRSLSDPLDTHVLTAAVATNNASQPKIASRRKGDKERENILDKREERLTQFFCDLAKSSVWREDQGFLIDNPFTYEKQKNFYIQANQLFIFGRTIGICPLCTRQKKKKGEPRSHIFPRALLELYAAIHCKGDGQFIYDLSDGKPRGAPGLSFPLFCDSCENNGSKEEGLLKDVYLQILGSESARFPITVVRVNKLKHILAILMFRGILLGVNFLKEVLNAYFTDFYEVFIQLRDYCYETECEFYKNKEISNRIYLSLLPNSHFTKYNFDPSYILDLQLRNPEFTSVVVIKGAVFLYTKFDCFHCTLPITPTHNKSLRGSSCFDLSFKDLYDFPNQRLGVQIFPQLLLDYNLSKIEKLAYHLFLFNNSAFMTCKCIVQRFKMREWEPFPLGDNYSIEVEKSDGFELQSLKKDELMQKAQDNSPFFKYHPNDIERVCELNLRKRDTIAEEKLKHKNEILTEAKKANRNLKADLNKCSQEFNELQKRYKQVIEENDNLKEEIRSMKELQGEELQTNRYTNPVSSSPHT